MRIAQVAPLWERVPPPTYGGIELIVSLLTEELVKRGHEVTLFASGDSLTSAKLVAVHPRALRLDSTIKEPAVYELLNLASVYEKAPEFDIIHSHVGLGMIPYSNFLKTPTVHTLHGIFTADNQKVFEYGKTQPYISISNSQRETKLGLNYLATIYNGINVSSYKFYPQPIYPPYLAFLGRLSPEKGVHLAIKIAQETGYPLKIAGKVDNVDKAYFQELVKPHIDGEQIEYLGEANHIQKNTIMGNAIATLFPITWREPFGLVMIESMASGTPVVAMHLGATEEVIVDGKTGFLCDNIQECIYAIDKIETLNRYSCRQYVENNFSYQKMTDSYEAVYQNIITAKLSAQNGFIIR